MSISHSKDLNEKNVMLAASTLVDVVQTRAALSPDRGGFFFLDGLAYQPLGLDQFEQIGFDGLDGFGTWLR